MKPLYVIQIPKEHILTENITMITDAIATFENLKAGSSCMEIIVDGYDESTDEVFEIKEIRNWMMKLLRLAPEVLYYASMEMGTTFRILACCFDMETVITKRMNAFEAVEYLMTNSTQHHQPLIITISEHDRLKIYGNIKAYGLKRKDIYGANEIVRQLKEVFEKGKESTI